MPCSMEDLSSPSRGIEPVIPAVEAQSLNHWTTRELSSSDALKGLTGPFMLLLPATSPTLTSSLPTPNMSNDKSLPVLQTP